MYGFGLTFWHENGKIIYRFRRIGGALKSKQFFLFRLKDISYNLNLLAEGLKDYGLR